MKYVILADIHVKQPQTAEESDFWLGATEEQRSTFIADSAADITKLIRREVTY